MLGLQRSFYYTPDPSLISEFSCTPNPSFSAVFLMPLMVVLVRSFSYTPHASISEEFLEHS